MYGEAPSPLAESSVILLMVAPKLSQTREGHRADFLTPVAADHNEEQWRYAKQAHFSRAEAGSDVHPMPPTHLSHNMKLHQHVVWEKDTKTRKGFKLQDTAKKEAVT